MTGGHTVTTTLGHAAALRPQAMELAGLHQAAVDWCRALVAKLQASPDEAPLIAAVEERLARCAPSPS